MPKITGLFEIFDNLDQMPIDAVAAWLKPVPQLVALENYLANRILYPQVLPQTEYDMQTDLAILREALKINGPKFFKNSNALLGDNPFINITMRKLMIPLEFVNFVPTLSSLVYAFIDAFLLDRKKKDWFEDLWSVVLTDDSDETVGSVILPQFDTFGGIINLKLLGKNYQIKQGGLTIIPCSKDRCEIAYKLQNGKVLGKTENAIEVSGGKLGLVVDGRNP
ncbi:hypothetical protein HYU94_02700 [Candidatus Daviesbacteria bacterium]|nr:hypothetical protein [Candidatus Daviesbacteria bacterium]